MAGNIRLAADIGGTFTDVAAFDEAGGRLLLGKTLSTPQRMVDGIDTAVAKAGTAFAEAGLFLHGSTVAINTMLERTGARTALLITEGFRDVYEIGRVNRPDAYNLFFTKHVPLVPRIDRHEVKERLRADGAVHRPLDEDHLRALAARLKDENFEAVAVILLHCYRNPAHEIRVREILTEALPGAFISTSHELSQEYREFERCSTVVANAYIGPRVERYLAGIGERISDAGFAGTFLVVQSTGGLFGMDQAKRECIRILESGPAAGVIGTQAVCRAIGLKNAIAFDMGGTTAKAGVIHDGEVLTTGSALVGGYDKALPVQIPMIDIFEVGTGGGSIARVEHGGLTVGPQSAGAEPGPACYGRGGSEATITDANLVLGRLGADRFLGGEMTLDRAAAERALADGIAKPLGLTVTDAADGILRIAATKMSYAVKGVTTERGLDAGGFALVAYGGAGPLHAAAVARELGLRTVIVPRAPGHFSAFGMLFADLRHDYVRTRFCTLAEFDFAAFEQVFAELEAEGRAAVAAASVQPRTVTVARALDMRYVGQEHVVTVDVPMAHFEKRDRAGIKALFDEIHRRRYGTAAPDEKAEVASLRTTVTGVLSKPPLEKIAAGTAAPPPDAATGTRPAWFAGAGFLDTPTFRRDNLLAGNRIAGPALVEEHASTTVVMPDDRLDVDAYGNLVISIGGNR